MNPASTFSISADTESVESVSAGTVSADTVSADTVSADTVSAKMGQKNGMPSAASARKRQFEFNKLQKRLRRHVGNAIVDYQMIEAGDKVMVCLSGGKDSFCMLDILLSLQKTAPIDFDIVAVNMDQKQPGFPEHILPEYLSKLGVDYHIVERDTYSVVKELIPEGKTTCGLCSRLRRGTLYGFAEEIGATKIALGHHKEDIVETLFLNLFFGGRLKAMPPKLLSDDKRNVLIRPLAYCREKDLQAYSDHKQFPIIPCNLCGSQENLQRQSIKQMLKAWEKDFPGRTETIFTALQKVSPSQLADRDLFDFVNMAIDRSEPAPVSQWDEQTEMKKSAANSKAGHERLIPTSTMN